LDQTTKRCAGVVIITILLQVLLSASI